MQAVYVCVCNGVTDRDIQRAVDEGCDSLEALAARTGCGSTCGCCREYAEEAIAQAKSTSLGLPIAA
jgi:bacterioferritin-associated ferredoxin